MDMHIDVDPDIAVIRAHEISHDVQKILEEVDLGEIRFSPYVSLWCGKDQGLRRFEKGDNRSY